MFNISGERYVTFDGIARACAKAMGAPEPELVHFNAKDFDFGKKKVRALVLCCVCAVCVCCGLQGPPCMPARQGTCKQRHVCALSVGWRARQPTTRQINKQSATFQPTAPRPDHATGIPHARPALLRVDRQGAGAARLEPKVWPC